MKARAVPVMAEKHETTKTNSFSQKGSAQASLGFPNSLIPHVHVGTYTYGRKRPEPSLRLDSCSTALERTS